MQKKRVLFVCTGNSCRSQMGEALVGLVTGGAWEGCSAGSHPAHYVHPLAIAAMRELGVDISRNRSKSVDEFAGQKFDFVITVCDHAARHCPMFPGAGRTFHWPMEDPAALSDDPEAGLALARRVRDDLRRRLEELARAEAGKS